MKHKVGIIGLGFVGSAVETGLQNVSEIRVYDKYKDTESLETVVNESNILFICVPTPRNEDGSCDTSIVESVCKQIDKLASKPKTIVIKSTVIPGTTERLALKYPKHCFLFNPEFLTEKRFIEDFLGQDRIILGYTTNELTKQNVALRLLYEDFIKTQKKPAIIVQVESREAEMVKYIANSFLFAKVLFFNEMKELCDKINLDYNKVVKLVLLDTRIGNSHYQVPGPDGMHGSGGGCFSKDIPALVKFAGDLGVDLNILHTAWLKNLTIREEYEWDNLPQVTGKYKKKC